MFQTHLIWFKLQGERLASFIARFLTTGGLLQLLVPLLKTMQPLLDDWDWCFFWAKFGWFPRKPGGWTLQKMTQDGDFLGFQWGLRMKMVSATRIPGCASWFKHPKSRKISINGSWSIPNRGKPPGWMKYVNLGWAPIYNAYSYVGQFMMKPPVLLCEAPGGKIPR